MVAASKSPACKRGGGYLPGTFTVALGLLAFYWCGAVRVQDFTDDLEEDLVSASEAIDTRACNPANDTCFTIVNHATVPISIVALKSRIVPKMIQGSLVTQVIVPKINNHMKPLDTWTFSAEPEFPGRWLFKFVVDDGPDEFEWSLTNQVGVILASAVIQETGRRIIKYSYAAEAVGLTAGAKVGTYALSVGGPMLAPVGFVAGYAAGKWGTYQGGGAITTYALNAYEDRYHVSATAGLRHRHAQLKKWKDNNSAVAIDFYHEVLRAVPDVKSWWEQKLDETHFWNHIVGMAMPDSPVMIKKHAVKYWKQVDSIYRYSGTLLGQHTLVYPGKKGRKVFEITGGFKPGEAMHNLLLEWKGLRCDKIDDTVAAIDDENVESIEAAQDLGLAEDLEDIDEAELPDLADDENIDAEPPFVSY